MQFDMPPKDHEDQPDKPVNANVLLASEYLSGQQDNVKHTVLTQKASLPPKDNTVITPEQGGLIKDMRFPGSWTKVQQEESAVPGYKIDLYSFNDAKDVFMSYKYRGGDSYITADAIHQVMAKSDHKLGVSELERVRKGLVDSDQDLPKYFDLKQAWTQTVDGQRVLFVEGTYKQNLAKGRPALTAYIDSDPSRPGRLPESITYFVDSKDQADYEKYRPLAMKSFESMEFKPHVDTSNPGFSSLN